MYQIYFVKKNIYIYLKKRIYQIYFAKKYMCVLNIFEKNICIYFKTEKSIPNIIELK